MAGFGMCHAIVLGVFFSLPSYLYSLPFRKARRKDRDGDSTSESGDAKPYLQESLLERQLPEVDVRALVELPNGLDLNEWLASHTVALFDHVNLLYGAVSEFCTPASCPDTAGPGGKLYTWTDERGKKVRLAAPHYVDYVMTYVQRTLHDENVFPTKYGCSFPAGFEAVVRRALRLLFHVLAHLYAAHFRSLALLRLHQHLHLTFAYLTHFHRRFQLLDAKETEVLRDLELALRLTDPPAGPAPPHRDPAPAVAGPSPAIAGPSLSPGPVVTQPTASL